MMFAQEGTNLTDSSGLQKQPQGFAELTPRQELLALNHAIHALASLAHPGPPALAMGTRLGKWSQG